MDRDRHCESLRQKNKSAKARSRSKTKTKTKTKTKKVVLPQTSPVREVASNFQLSKSSRRQENESCADLSAKKSLARKRAAKRKRERASGTLRFSGGMTVSRVRRESPSPATTEVGSETDERSHTGSPVGSVSPASAASKAEALESKRASSVSRWRFFCCGSNATLPQPVITKASEPASPAVYSQHDDRGADEAGAIAVSGISAEEKGAAAEKRLRRPADRKRLNRADSANIIVYGDSDGEKSDDEREARIAATQAALREQLVTGVVKQKLADKAVVLGPLSALTPRSREAVFTTGFALLTSQERQERETDLRKNYPTLFHGVAEGVFDREAEMRLKELVRLNQGGKGAAIEEEEGCFMDTPRLGGGEEQ